LPQIDQPQVAPMILGAETKHPLEVGWQGVDAAKQGVARARVNVLGGRLRGLQGQHGIAVAAGHVVQHVANANRAVPRPGGPGAIRERDLPRAGRVGNGASLVRLHGVDAAMRPKVLPVAGLPHLHVGRLDRLVDFILRVAVPAAAQELHRSLDRIGKGHHIGAGHATGSCDSLMFFQTATFAWTGMIRSKGTRSNAGTGSNSSLRTSILMPRVSMSWDTSTISASCGSPVLSTNRTNIPSR